MGGVIVLHAPRHPRCHRELSGTFVHDHLEIFNGGNVERSYLAVRVNSGEVVRLKAVTVHSATPAHLNMDFAKETLPEKQPYS